MAAAAVCLTAAAPAAAAPTTGWHAIADAGSQTGGMMFAPEVAVGEDGTVAVAWAHGIMLTGSTVAVRAPGSSTWDREDLAVAGMSMPHLAVTPSGETLALLADGTVRSRPAGGDFGAPAPAIGAGMLQDLVALPDGRVLATSQTISGPLTAAVRGAGDPSFGPGQTLTGAGEMAQPAALATGPDATGAIAWTSLVPGTPNTYRVRTAMLEPGSTDFTVQTVDESTVDNVTFGLSRISVGPQGALDLAYHQTEPMPMPGMPDITIPMPAAVLAAHRASAPAAAWGPPAVAELPEGGSSLGMPAIASTADGGALVSFPQNPTPTTSELATLRRAPGAAQFVAGEPLESGAAGTVGGFYSLAALPDGRVLFNAGGMMGAASVGVIGTDGALEGTDTIPGSPMMMVMPSTTMPASTNGTAAVVTATTDMTDPMMPRVVYGVQLFDGAAPALSGVQVPGTATAGAPVPLAATATERESGPAAITWDFGNGRSAEGAAATALYEQPGTYTVRATAGDTRGNASSAVRTIVVTAPQGGPAPDDGGQAKSVTDRTAPVISGLALSSKRFRVAAARTVMAAAKKKRKPKKGTALYFQSSEDAKVAIAVERSRKGWRVGKACSTKRPKGKKAKKAKRCRTTQVLGVLTRQAGEGANAVGFSGRLGKKALKAGAYRFSVVATDAAGNVSKPARTGFTIAKR